MNPRLSFIFTLLIILSMLLEIVVFFNGYNSGVEHGMSLCPTPVHIDCPFPQQVVDPAATSTCKG